MKRILISGIAVSFALLALMAFTYPTLYHNNPQEKPASAFPEDVEKVLQTSCFDCHTDAASNAKAKMKLNFSKWGELSDSKKIGKMESISEVIKKGDMPPGKYLEKYPDHALNPEQKSLIDTWVTEESKKLMGE
jgi:hypothetical protein